MKRKIPIGIQDYRKLRTENYFIVDKTLMIADFLQRGSEVTLITRPRRFGKTLNMSMLAEFFDITKDSKSLFEGLAIMDTPYAKEMNQYPVIFLSFANCKGNLDNVKKLLFSLFRQLYAKSICYLDSDAIIDDTKARYLETYAAICEGKNFLYLNEALILLCEVLYTYYGKRVMLFLDEYDTPFIEAHVHDYYDEIHDVLASLLRISLKGNDYLQYGMLTGIQRVAKENVFSDLNNLVVCSVKDKEYDSYFGFTKEETKKLLEEYNLSYSEDVKQMYDGYHIGDKEIYNPWSIINYASTSELRAFWINTSANTMIKKAMNQCEQAFKEEFELLIQQGFIETEVLLETSFFEQSQTSSLWGLFVNAGYLTIDEVISIEDNWYKIRIPNKEVRNEFRSLTANYLKIEDVRMTAMMMALKRKDVNAFFQIYQDVILQLPSYHDLRNENSYHLMMLGMCAWLSNEYSILSNRENGEGRADIILKKKKNNLPNIILEFKFIKKDDVKSDDLEKLAQEGLDQIKERKYAIDLQETTICIGLAHQGKLAAMKYKEINFE